MTLARQLHKLDIIAMCDDDDHDDDDDGDDDNAQ